MIRRVAVPLCLLVAMSAVFDVSGIRPAQAQTAADVQNAVSKLCGVMSGSEKPDGQFLQLYQLMEGDMSEANPVATGIQRGVLSQCPKSYLSFQQRARAANPFAAHPLVNGSVNLLGPSTSLSATPAPPQDYAFFCRGGSAMASQQNAMLVVRFADPGHAAASGLSPGQCTWWSRTLHSGEPLVIHAKLANAKQAKEGVDEINAGGKWTFWVYNVDGKYFNTTEIAKGYSQTKPQAAQK